MNEMQNGNASSRSSNQPKLKLNLINGTQNVGLRTKVSVSPLPQRADKLLKDGTDKVINKQSQLQKFKKVSFSDDESNKPIRRLLLVSNKCKYGALLEKAVKPHVVAILYNYENTTFDSLLALVSMALEGDEKVSSVGCVMSCKHSGIFILNCHDHAGLLNSTSEINKNSRIGKFFKLLFDTFVDKGHGERRLDLFGAAVVNQLDKNLRAIEDITGSTINISKEPLGIGNGSVSLDGTDSMGEMYFTPDKIRNWLNGTYQTIDLFEKIRMVGKGAFGTAVLYRKKDDNSLVILKEINMSELNSQERQLAMNETKVLKLLNHPNIICCYDSFEENGVLMIEMEYADDGTLAQLLAKQESPLLEIEVLQMFCQIVSGIRYMHEQKVLHRDLKTANIFLTKDCCVKIGDFGVSKIMSSHNRGANTVLGTPYYISPEICEGKPYDEKSDIWALGCILHEMATCQKTFEGTNLPALVNKIMRGHIAPIQGNFSSEFKQLVNDMLHREPGERPTAHILDVVRLPDIMDNFGSEGSERSFSSSRSQTKGSRDISSATHRETRSVLYMYDTSALSILPMEGFPTKIKIREVAIGENHFIAVAVELTVYTWGQGDHGQLGHGSLEFCPKPQVVEALKGKSVTSACAGASFSIFVSDNGIVMTCGDGRHGCLGHGSYVSSQRPRLIESLLSVDVSSVACGLHHVVALGSEGKVFAWGDGKDGCLGIGETNILEEPTEVPIQEGVAIRDIRCGPDGTMFITEVGTLLACGNNKFNKLGLNERRGFLTVLSNKLKLEVEFKKTPTPVKAIKGVIDVSMGKNHTAILTEVGDLFMLGSNKHSQLGTGDNKVRSTPFVLKSLREYEVATVICGDKYTAVGTSDGTVWLWGTRFKQASVSDEVPQTPTAIEAPEVDGKDSSNSYSGSHNLFVKPTHRRTFSGTSTVSYRSTLSLNQENGSTSEGPSRASSYQDVTAALGDKAINSRTTTDFDLESNRSTPTNTATSPLDMRMPEIMSSPYPILNIQGSPESADTAASTPDSTTVKDDLAKSLSGEKSPSFQSYTAFLDTLISCAENFYMLVETNAPVTSLKDTTGQTDNKKGQLKTQISCLNLPVPTRRHGRSSVSSNEVGDEYTSSETSELDSFGTAPTWIREELKITLKAVATDASSTKKQSLKDSEKVQKIPALTTKQRKTSPSPSRSKATGKNKVVDCSSSGSSNQSTVKQSRNLLSVDTSSSKSNAKGTRKSRSPSPYTRRSPQSSFNRLRGGQGRSRMNQWDQPKPSRSPVRGNNMQELRAKLVQIQNEKRDTEKKLKEVQERNENMLRDLQVKHEKEKLEQERWLHDQISSLKRQLGDQQREINERDPSKNGGKLVKHGSKSDSVKSSKICNIQ
ncbi:uncharacterized protein LOC120331911 [Styela clava]